MSGSGKTTMMELLLASSHVYEKVCSLTTRKPREGEVSWDHYVFTSSSEFEVLIKEKKLLEYAFVHQIAYYGTRMDWIQETLQKGKSPVKTIDMVGMEIIDTKNRMPDEYVCIFIDIPEEIMKERILWRQEHMSGIELQHRLNSVELERAIAKRIQNCTIVDGSKTREEVFAQIQEVLSKV